MIRVRIDQIRPSLLDHNYIERQGRVKKLEQIFHRIFSGGASRFTKSNLALLLDLGGGESPYRKLAETYPVRWISVDRQQFRCTNVILDAQSLPFKNGTFDILLCNQVMELVPNLFCAADEIYRVLKPRGIAILSNPAVFPPYGYAKWRIMPEGYKTLLAGFSEYEVDSDVNTVASLFRVTNLYLAIILQNTKMLGMIWRVSICPLFNIIGRWANGRFKDIGFAANYVVVAKK